jgi:predicted patatin/cPLA2 family phospholipase
MNPQAEIVARNVLHRAAERQSGIPASDIKTALVVQGGGTRSVTSCGAAAALGELGLTNAFDEVYAVSSGALNAAYFLSGQSALGISVYLDDITSPQFINWLRYPRIMNLDFLFDDVVKKRKRHNLEATLNHPSPLRIVTMDGETGEPVWFCSHDRSVDFHLALKASCAVPVATTPVLVNGRKLMDGMVVEPIPLPTVLERDFTDLLVLHTRDFGYRAKEIHPFIQFLGGLSLSRPAHQRFVGEPKLFNHLTDILESGSYTNRAGRQVRLGGVFPSNVTQMSRFERSTTRLLDAACSSWSSVMTMFGHPEKANPGEFRRYLDAAGIVIKP